MTAAVTPGRDELTLVAEIQEFDSFLNQPPAYEDQTMVRDYRHAAYAKWSMLSRKIVARIAAKPADENADAAVARENHWRKLEGRDPAPPQPAPDAMRKAHDALQGLLAWTGATRAGITDSEERMAFEDDLKIAQKARETIYQAISSAPVPSPDGIDRRWFNDLIKAAEAFRVAVIFSRALDKIPQDQFIDQLRALEAALNPFNYRPSGAGAAEPVQRDTNMFSRLAHEPLAVIPEGYSAPLDIRTAAEIEFDRKAAKSAVPPVRGDREAIIRLAEIHLGAWLKSSDPALQLVPTAARQDIRDFAGAILSLPSAPVSETPDRAHYLSAIRLRLEQLSDASAGNPRLREQLSDEVDWIDAQIEQSPAAPVSGRDAATLEACAQIAKFGAKECADGDTDWHKGFRYAAHSTALEIESSIRALSNHKESGP